MANRYYPGEYYSNPPPLPYGSQPSGYGGAPIISEYEIEREERRRRDAELAASGYRVGGRPEYVVQQQIYYPQHQNGPTIVPAETYRHSHQPSPYPYAPSASYAYPQGPYPGPVTYPEGMYHAGMHHHHHHPLKTILPTHEERVGLPPPPDGHYHHHH